MHILSPVGRSAPTPRASLRVHIRRARSYETPRQRALSRFQQVRHVSVNCTGASDLPSPRGGKVGPNDKAAVESIDGIRHLTPANGGQYDVWLLDQFGVLHDGDKAYPGAIQAIRQLHASGAKLYILSNSSRRSTRTLDVLAKKGFDKEWFSGVMTSGEVTHDMLLRRPSGTVFDGLGHKYLHFSWGPKAAGPMWGGISLDGLDLAPAPRPRDADFLLAHGTETINDVESSLEEMREALAEAAASERTIPLIIANPDIVSVSSSGMNTMPGQLGRWYSEMGGEVHLMGKPAAVIYEGAMVQAGMADPNDRTRVIAVGDSLEHDVQGAINAGIDSIFCMGGIHRDDLSMVSQPLDSSSETEMGGQGSAVPVSSKNFVTHPRDEALRAVIQREGFDPAFAMPSFRW